MSLQPFHAPDDDVEFVLATPPTEEELDEIELMWLERESKPWKPTVRNPIRAGRCTGVTRTGPRAGRRCGRESTMGLSVCTVHGAQLPSVRAAARSRVEEARLRLIDKTPELADWLVDLAENSASDAVRVKAITEAMDRAGLKGGMEIDVKVETVQDPAEALRERLASLQRRNPQIIDAEIVPDTVDEDEPEQLALDWE